MTTLPSLPSPARRIAAGAVLSCLALLAVGSGATPAAAATKPSAECQAVITTLQGDVTAAANSGVEPDTHEADLQKLELQDAFENAKEQFPQCGTDIDTFVAQLSAAARQAATVKGTPFWGPIGWTWNVVYYKVFNGNDIMMGMFGWALLLSPFILVFAVYSVLKGASGAFRRPKVPEHLRSQP
jgi:hypothetical protein